MNPEENNPLTSSTGMPGMGGMNNQAAMPGIGGLSMADSLASAQDNLTSAGLAAPSAQGVMGLDQLGASNPEAVMAPPMEEPLVPAAPVPGSIGSVTSVPAGNMNPINPFAPTEPMGAQPAQGGPVQVPDVAPQAPFNPFAPVEPTSQNPAVTAANSPMNPAAPNAQPSAPAGQPAAANAPKPGINPAFQPAAPAHAKKTQGGKKPMNMTVILLAALSAVLAIALVVFIVLFVNAINNPKVVYVPTTSNEDSNNSIEMLSCSKETDFAFLVGSEYPINGSESFSASYSKDQIKALSLKYDIIFGEGYDLNIARDNLAAGQVEFVNSLGNKFTADYTVDQDELIAEIKSANNAELTENEINAFLHSNGENLGNNSIEAIQTQYEALGFTCSIE